MENKLCLNCTHEITKNFCANCGQKADTHRITFTKFIAHDLLHGVWHLDRGILFTLKEAIVRPGKAALDYIGGKRIRYYNIFYLCLLLLAANVLLSHFYDKALYGNVASEDSEFVTLLSKNLKFVVLSFVPLLALNGWLFFRKLKLNIAEHFIIGGMSMLGILIFTFPFVFAIFIENYRGVTVGILKLVLVAPILLYPVWTYRNATKGIYSFPKFLWRIVLYLLLTYAEILALLGALMLLATGDTDIEISM